MAKYQRQTNCPNKYRFYNNPLRTPLSRHHINKCRTSVDWSKEKYISIKSDLEKKTMQCRKRNQLDSNFNPRVFKTSTARKMSTGFKPKKTKKSIIRSHKKGKCDTSSQSSPMIEYINLKVKAQSKVRCVKKATSQHLEKKIDLNLDQATIDRSITIDQIGVLAQGEPVLYSKPLYKLPNMDSTSKSTSNSHTTKSFLRNDSQIDSQFVARDNNLINKHSSMYKSNTATIATSSSFIKSPKPETEAETDNLTQCSISESVYSVISYLSASRTEQRQDHLSTISQQASNESHVELITLSPISCSDLPCAQKQKEMNTQNNSPVQLETHVNTWDLSQIPPSLPPRVSNVLINDTDSHLKQSNWWKSAANYVIDSMNYHNEIDVEHAIKVGNSDITGSMCSTIPTLSATEALCSSIPKPSGTPGQHEIDSYEGNLSPVEQINMLLETSVDYACQSQLTSRVFFSETTLQEENYLMESYPIKDEGICDIVPSSQAELHLKTSFNEPKTCSLGLSKNSHSTEKQAAPQQNIGKTNMSVDHLSKINRDSTNHTNCTMNQANQSVPFCSTPYTQSTTKIFHPPVSPWLPKSDNKLNSNQSPISKSILALTSPIQCGSEVIHNEQSISDLTKSNSPVKSQPTISEDLCSNGDSQEMAVGLDAILAPGSSEVAQTKIQVAKQFVQCNNNSSMEGLSDRVNSIIELTSSEASPPNSQTSNEDLCYNLNSHELGDKVDSHLELTSSEASPDNSQTSFEDLYSHLNSQDLANGVDAILALTCSEMSPVKTKIIREVTVSKFNSPKQGIKGRLIPDLAESLDCIIVPTFSKDCLTKNQTSLEPVSSTRCTENLQMVPTPNFSRLIVSKTKNLGHCSLRVVLPRCDDKGTEKMRNTDGIPVKSTRTHRKVSTVNPDNYNSLSDISSVASYDKKIAVPQADTTMKGKNMATKQNEAKTYPNHKMLKCYKEDMELILRDVSNHLTEQIMKFQNSTSDDLRCTLTIKEVKGKNTVVNVEKFKLYSIHKKIEGNSNKEIDMKISKSISVKSSKPKEMAKKGKDNLRGMLMVNEVKSNNSVVNVQKFELNSVCRTIEENLNEEIDTKISKIKYAKSRKPKATAKKGKADLSGMPMIKEVKGGNTVVNLERFNLNYIDRQIEGNMNEEIDMNISKNISVKSLKPKETAIKSKLSNHGSWQVNSDAPWWVQAMKCLDSNIDLSKESYGDSVTTQNHNKRDRTSECKLNAHDLAKEKGKNVAGNHRLIKSSTIKSSSIETGKTLSDRYQNALIITSWGQTKGKGCAMNEKCDTLQNVNKPEDNIKEACTLPEMDDESPEIIILTPEDIVIEKEDESLTIKNRNARWKAVHEPDLGAGEEITEKKEPKNRLVIFIGEKNINELSEHKKNATNNYPAMNTDTHETGVSDSKGLQDINSDEKGKCSHNTRQKGKENKVSDEVQSTLIQNIIGLDTNHTPKSGTTEEQGNSKKQKLLGKESKWETTVDTNAIQTIRVNTGFDDSIDKAVNNDTGELQIYEEDKQVRLKSYPKTSMINCEEDLTINDIDTMSTKYSDSDDTHYTEMHSVVTEATINKDQDKIVKKVHKSEKSNALNCTLNPTHNTKDTDVCNQEEVIHKEVDVTTSTEKDNFSKDFNPKSKETKTKGDSETEGEHFAKPYGLNAKNKKSKVCSEMDSIIPEDNPDCDSATILRKKIREKTKLLFDERETTNTVIGTVHLHGNEIHNDVDNQESYKEEKHFDMSSTQGSKGKWQATPKEKLKSRHKHIKKFDKCKKIVREESEIRGKPLPETNEYLKHNVREESKSVVWQHQNNKYNGHANRFSPGTRARVNWSSPTSSGNVRGKSSAKAYRNTQHPVIGNKGSQYSRKHRFSISPYNTGKKDHCYLAPGHTSIPNTPEPWLYNSNLNCDGQNFPTAYW